MAAYLREHLRGVMTAKRPYKKDYHSWQELQFFFDSLAWENDPLYGWCNKNFKRDGSPYDIYVDGLRVFTTIDSKMQGYAEKALKNHLVDLQARFDKEKKGAKNAPYSNNLTQKQIQEILDRAMRQSERWVTMKSAGFSEEEIRKSFQTPVQMTVFSYNGDVDTLMTPADSVRYYKGFLRSGMLSIEPQTGRVKAYVGGVNYTHFQYDMAIKGRRQVGSTIKPFVYAMAMEDGYMPEDTICNIQRTYHVSGQPWTPRNSGKSRIGENVTLKWGLSQSNNWITAELMYRTAPTGARFVDLLRDFGVVNPDMHPSIALCLGTPDITVGEMASAYTAFVNRGIRCAPILVDRIEDSEGNVIAEFTPRMNEVISEGSSYKMIDMMRAVVDGGTGGRVRRYGITAPVAGKTGTTNSNSDGWFMGCVPRLVTACWVGGEDRDIHFNSMANGQGAAAALPIWALFMKDVFADSTLGYSQEETFTISEDFLEQERLKAMEDSILYAPHSVQNSPSTSSSDDSYFE
jgi:penicillin-binding protein 1A